MSINPGNILLSSNIERRLQWVKALPIKAPDARLECKENQAIQEDKKHSSPSIQ